MAVPSNGCIDLLPQCEKLFSKSCIFNCHLPRHARTFGMKVLGKASSSISGKVICFKAWASVMLLSALSVRAASSCRATDGLTNQDWKR